MKCPYAVNRKRLTQCNIEYDEVTEQQTTWTEVETNNAIFIDCLKDDCGAWQNGHCCYNKSSD